MTTSNSFGKGRTLFTLKVWYGRRADTSFLSNWFTRKASITAVFILMRNPMLWKSRLGHCRDRTLNSLPALRFSPFTVWSTPTTLCLGTLSPTTQNSIFSFSLKLVTLWKRFIASWVSRRRLYGRSLTLYKWFGVVYSPHTYSHVTRRHHILSMADITFIFCRLVSLIINIHGIAYMLAKQVTSIVYIVEKTL